MYFNYILYTLWLSSLLSKQNYAYGSANFCSCVFLLLKLICISIDQRQVNRTRDTKTTSGQKTP